VGREFGTVDKVIGRRELFAAFRKVSAHAEFVRCTSKLWLNVDCEGGGLEWTFHNIFHFRLTEGAMHVSSRDFIIEVV
jgi:hypothetical protein